MSPSAAAVLDFMLLLRPSLGPRGSRFSLSPELRRGNTAGCILQRLMAGTDHLCALPAASPRHDVLCLTLRPAFAAKRPAEGLSRQRSHGDSS
jgi:hypothetical protein